MKSSLDFAESLNKKTRLVLAAAALMSRLNGPPVYSAVTPKKTTQQF